MYRPQTTTRGQQHTAILNRKKLSFATVSMVFGYFLLICAVVRLFLGENVKKKRLHSQNVSRVKQK